MIGRLRCLKPKSLEKQGTSYTKSDVDDAYLKGISDAKNELEKQGEQRYLVGADLGDPDGDKGCRFDYSNATIQQKDFASKEVEPRYEIGDVLCDKSCTTLDKNTQPNLEVTDIRNGMYICDKGCFPISQQDEYELVAKRIEQKTAWSEEDEKEYKYVLKFVDNILNNCGNKKDYEHCKRCYDWLKSLKERIGE